VVAGAGPLASAIRKVCSSPVPGGLASVAACGAGSPPGELDRRLKRLGAK